MSKITRLAALAVVVIVSIALSVGCGGDGSPSATSNGGGSEQAGRDGGEQADRDGVGDGAPGGGDDASGKADGSPDATVPTSSLNKRQFVRRANRICKRGRSNMLGKLAVYVERRMSGNKAQKVLIAEAVKRRMLPTFERENDEIRALGGPEGDEARIGAILAAQRAAIDEVAELESTTLKEVAERFSGATQEYTAYGLAECTV